MLIRFEIPQIELRNENWIIYGWILPDRFEKCIQIARLAAKMKIGKLHPVY